MFDWASTWARGIPTPVPVGELVGELLPKVMLVTVTVAVCGPVLLDVNVTWYVAVPPFAATVVGALLTTNCGLLEVTVTPAAATLPVLVIVYVTGGLGVPQEFPLFKVPVIA